MNKGKKIWIALFFALTLLVVLSGCSGLPKTAKINIAIDPNPAPYDAENEGWWYYVTFSESNGVGVTLIILRFDGYNQAEELVYTDIYYEEDIIDWFESNYIPAFSTLSDWVWHTGTNKYTILTVAGIDDNDNPIEATGRIDFLPQ